MSDLFHADIPDEFIAEVWAVMARAPQHAYQILTKRHDRMRSLVAGILYDRMARDLSNVDGIGTARIQAALRWPLPGVWLGVSVEDQQWADVRIPSLLDTPAAVRWLSCEPLIGPIDLSPWLPRPFERQQGGYWVYGPGTDAYGEDRRWAPGPSISWVVIGGESGPGARRMDPQWARDIRDQCAAADVPFFFKQTGTVLACELGIPGKGEDWDRLPAEFRVRDYPQEVT